MNEVAPVRLFDFSSQVPMPITLNKQERAILPKPVEKLVDTLPKPVISHKNSEVPKLEKMNKEKKEAKEEKAEKPKLAVCPPAPEQKEHRRVRRSNTEKKGFGKKYKGAESSTDNQKKAANAAVKLPGRLTEDVKVDSHVSSVSKERS